MKRTVMTKLIIFIPALLIISSCGGGVASNTGTNSGDNNTTQQTTAIVKLTTTGTLPSNSWIGGIDVALHLPTGVSVKSGTNPPETDSGVVTASGVAASNSSLVSTFTTTFGVVHILLANPNGFGPGEFATVICDIAAGSHPVQTDFSVSGMTTKDLNGSAINGLTTGVTADIH